MSFTIGSLFDGSGGFPLAATMCGGTPKWASEVEPFPIAVTWSRFPKMKHLGSVTDIKGGKVEPVDVITFGSPCQDLSVAGKRAGLKHEANGDDETTRSGLFMEAVRIIKEMREATNGAYPRFALWENVPGAFSSNKGEDFRIVLEELIKIVEPTAVMPEVPKNGWPYADSYCGDGWSLAYRVLDAQFWGVPQRRRRIYLVADFRGECAGKVSFEREGLRGYFETSRTPWQTVTGDVEGSSGTADCEGNSVIAVDQGGGKSGANFHDNLSPTLTCTHGGEPVVAYSFDSLASNSMKSNNPHSGCRQVEVSKCLDTTDPNPCRNQGGIAVVERIVLDDQGGQQINVRTDGKSPTLRAEMHGNVPSVIEPAVVLASECVDFGRTADRIYINPKTSVTPSAQGGGMGAKTGLYCLPVYCLQGNGIDRSDTAGCNGKGWKEDTCYTLNTIDRPAVVYSMKSIARNGKALAEQANPICASDYKDPDIVAYVATYQKVTGPLMANSHPGSYTGQDAFSDMLVAGKEEAPVVLDRAFFNQGQNAKYDPAFYTDGTVPTLVARGPSAVAVRYIVRRLTPTECARLQGFPDTWGHPNVKTELTDEEYQFWLNVRNTHAAINDKPTKEYTKEQMLKWYNGLHTDSSEYKMWGNGIALPNALYVMQGIAEVMSEEKTARRKWLDSLLGDCL